MPFLTHKFEEPAFDYAVINPLARELIDVTGKWSLRVQSPAFIVNPEKAKEQIRRSKDILKRMGF